MGRPGDRISKMSKETAALGSAGPEDCLQLAFSAQVEKEGCTADLGRQEISLLRFMADYERREKSRMVPIFAV